MRNHDAIDLRSLAMARRIVAKIDADPRRDGLEHARGVCARWVERGNVPAKEWMEILRRPWPEIRSILLDESEESRRLRQNDPFCGILTPRERWEIYRKAAADEARAGACASCGGRDHRRLDMVIVGSQAILGERLSELQPEVAERIAVRLRSLGF